MHHLGNFLVGVARSDHADDFAVGHREERNFSPRQKLRDRDTAHNVVATHESCLVDCIPHITQQWLWLLAPRNDVGHTERERLMHDCRIDLVGKENGPDCMSGPARHDRGEVVDFDGSFETHTT